MQTRLLHSAALALALGLASPAAVAGIALPPSVDRGVDVTLSISPPPGRDGRLVILPIEGVAGAERVSGPAVHSQPIAAGTAEAVIPAPGRAGSYIVVLEQAGRERQRAFLEVVARPLARFSMPATARAAEPVRVSIGRADAAGDLVRLADATTGTVLTERPITAEEAAAGALAVTAPSASGRYRLSYVDAGTGSTIASGVFSVDATKALIAASAVVTAGAPFDLRRIGPGGAGHSVRIESETGDVLREVNLAGSDGPDARFAMQAPARAGRYLIRYVALADGTVLSETPLIVTAN